MPDLVVEVMSLHMDQSSMEESETLSQYMTNVREEDLFLAYYTEQSVMIKEKGYQASQLIKEDSK